LGDGEDSFTVLLSDLGLSHPPQQAQVVLPYGFGVTALLEFAYAAMSVEHQWRSLAARLD
jgi:hypothetical protein